MRFLIPSGGMTDPRFGVLTAPNHKGIPAGIIAGLDWAADLGCLTGPSFVKRLQPEKALAWLETMLPFRDACLFVPLPDHVGDARATLEAWSQWQSRLSGWPLAYVAQDGSEDLPFPDDFSTLFVGGSTEWKTSVVAVEVIRRAQALGRHIHIGRVNWWKRYNLFRSLPGSETFTCDGTRTRYDGLAKVIEAWSKYQRRQPTGAQFSFYLQE